MADTATNEDLDFKGYVEDKYNGKLVTTEGGEEIIVQGISDLKFEHLDLEDQRLAMHPDVGWAWGLANDTLEKATAFTAYLFRPKQREAWFSPTPYTAYMGGYGSGKTLVMVLKGFMLCITYPGTRILFMRSTYPQLMSTTIATFMKVMHFFGYQEGIHYRHNISQKKIKIRVGNKESEILYMAAKNEGQTIQDAIQDLQSLEIDWFGADEATGVEERIILAAGNRVGRWGVIKNPVYHQVFLAGNPPMESHWIPRRFDRKLDSHDNPIVDPENYRVLHATSYENAVNLPPGYIKKIEAYPEYLRRAFLLGEWSFQPPEGMPVYKRFNADMYIRPTLQYNHKLPIIRGWDLGVTTVWKACVFAQVDSRGVLLILGEIVDNIAGIKQFGEKIITQGNLWFPKATEFIDYMDPVAFHKSQTDNLSPTDILATIGVGGIPGEESFAVRKDAVVNVFSRILDNGIPGMLLDKKRCDMLINGFLGGYRFKISEEAYGRFSMKPVKDIFSHPQDCVQYICSKIDPGQSKERESDKMQAQIRAMNSDMYKRRHTGRWGKKHPYKVDPRRL